MAYEIPLMTFTAVAGVDMTNKQFCFVKFSANNTVVPCAAVTDKPCGVLQDAPAIGQASQILALGISMVAIGAGGAIAAGDAIGTDALGLAVKKVYLIDTAAFSVGQCIQGAAAGTVGTVMVDCISPVYMPVS